MITVYERVGNAMSKSHVRLDTKGDFFYARGYYVIYLWFCTRTFSPTPHLMPLGRRHGTPIGAFVAVTDIIRDRRKAF